MYINKPCGSDSRGTDGCAAPLGACGSAYSRLPFVLLGSFYFVLLHSENGYSLLHCVMLSWIFFFIIITTGE